jgi:hypothetical protein
LNASLKGIITNIFSLRSTQLPRQKHLLLIMSTYYLSLKNTTAVQQHVFLFTAPPQIGQVADRNIFTNTWVDKYLDPNESLSVSTELNFYACGSRPISDIRRQLADSFTVAGPSLDDQGRTKVTQGVYTNPVTLGTSGGDPGCMFPNGSAEKKC